MMKKTLTYFCAIFLTSFLSQAHATTIIAPDSPHVVDNYYPFGSFFAPGRYQQVYDSSLFPGLVAIQSLAFSPQLSGNYGADLEIRLAQTSVAVGGLSATLDDNFTGALTTVFSDASFTQAVTGGSETFSLVFDFSTTPFIYDASGGQNLLLDIVINSSTFDGGGAFGVSRAGATGLSSRAWNSTSAFVGSASGADDFALRTQITYRVPEPATLALLGVGLAGLGLSKRRKQA